MIKTVLTAFAAAGLVLAVPAAAQQVVTRAADQDIVPAQAERRVEILRHRPQVRRSRRVVRVMPRRQRQRSHLRQHRLHIASIRENREPLCSAKDGRVTIEMVMGVFESHRLGGQRVELPLKSREHPLTRL